MEWGRFSRKAVSSSPSVTVPSCSILDIYCAFYTRTCAPKSQTLSWQSHSPTTSGQKKDSMEAWDMFTIPLIVQNLLLAKFTPL